MRPGALHSRPGMRSHDPRLSFQAIETRNEAAYEVRRRSSETTGPTSKLDTREGRRAGRRDRGPAAIHPGHLVGPYRRARRGGTIIAVNQAWRSFAGARLWAGDGIGMNYLRLRAQRGCLSRRGADRQAVHDIIKGRASEFRMEYPCTGPDGPRWFQLRVTRPETRPVSRIVVAHEDITEVKQAQAALARLTARLMKVQDDERRAIARELHDTTAQNLLAVSLNATRLREPSAAAGGSAPPSQRNPGTRRAKLAGGAHAVLRASSSAPRHDGSFVGTAMARRGLFGTERHRDRDRHLPRWARRCRRMPRRPSSGSRRKPSRISIAIPKPMGSSPFTERCNVRLEIADRGRGFQREQPAAAIRRSASASPECGCGSSSSAVAWRSIIGGRTGRTCPRILALDPAMSIAIRPWEGR